MNDVTVAEDGEDGPGAAVEEQAEGVVSVDDGRVLDTFIQWIDNNVKGGGCEGDNLLLFNFIGTFLRIKKHSFKLSSHNSKHY